MVWAGRNLTDYSVLAPLPQARNLPLDQTRQSSKLQTVQSFKSSKLQASYKKRQDLKAIPSGTALSVPEAQTNPKVASVKQLLFPL